MSNISSRLALIAALSSISASAFAQSGPSDAPGTANSDVVVVTASRTQSDAREIGSALTVTTEEDIKAGQVLFLKEVLQDIPGVQITSNRPGGLNSVSIRGSDNDQALFLLDGIELGDPSLITTQFTSENITSLDIGRIEVLRGNQSSLYGSDAIGGVVNIITQRATEDGFRINAEAEGGSENTRSGGVSLLGKSGIFDYRLTGTAFAADGPSLADPDTGPATEDDAYERWSLSGRAGVQLAETLEAQVMGFYSDSDSDLDGTNSDNLNTVGKYEYGAALQVTHETTDRRWRNELTVSRYNSERRYYGTFNLPYGDTFDGTKDTALYVLNFRPSRLFEVAAGLNWEKEATDQVTNFSGNFQAEITTESAFVEVAVRPTQALSFTLASRLDDNSRFGAFDTYRVTGAYYLPALLAGGDVKFRASYGTGAKAPGLFQLFDPTFGNPTLEVETSDGYDAGVDLIWEKAQLELTVFSTDITNEIDFDGSIPPFGRYAQFGKTESKGAEFGARVELAPWMFVSQSFTVLDTQNGETDRWKGRPRYSGSTSVTFQVTPRWDLTARMRYRSENKSSFGGATDAFKTLDLLTSYDITDSIELYGRIVNVSDEQYQLSFGSNAPDQGVFAGLRLKL